MPSASRVISACARTALVLALALCAAAPAAAAPGDIGFEGPSYAPAGGSLTGSKPESKLWWNGGGWWGVLWSPSSAGYRIARLNPSTGAWSLTGPTLDTRYQYRQDVLWNGATNKLYVASHFFSTSPATGYPARLYRFTYNPSTATYSLDAGFPAQISNLRTETLVIDRDSTGTLWATWTNGSRPYVAHTVGGNDASWSAPYIVPGAGTTLSSDDISSLVRFGGNKIGVMWSNQSDSKFYFASHADGAGDAASAWSTQQVPLAATADDHVNLKADGAGRVYAAVKTSESSSTRPLNVLLVRSAAGTWTSATFGTVANSHTRPIVALDEPAGRVHMYATGPQPPGTSGQSGGDIVMKTTSMSSPSFASGVGTPIIRNQGSPGMNDATSTKQGINAIVGSVVLANDADEDRYWHAQVAAGGGSTTPGPAASFTGTPTSGAAPLDVAFTDTSTGSPTSWSWTFGDGGTSTARNPTHTYAAAGTYTVSLTASNASGASTSTRTGYVTVSGGTGGATRTFAPAGDAYVQSGSPARNYGTAATLRVRSGEPTYKSYLRFDVGGVAGTVTRATLRLFPTDGGTDGGRVFGVPPASWTETGVTFANAPALAEPALGAFGAVTAGTWDEVDVTSAVRGNGTVSFGLQSASTNSVIYESREGTSRPQLAVTSTG
jgi:PKD repeat protein